MLPVLLMLLLDVQSMLYWTSISRYRGGVTAGAASLEISRLWMTPTVKLDDIYNVSFGLEVE